MTAPVLRFTLVAGVGLVIAFATAAGVFASDKPEASNTLGMKLVLIPAGEFQMGAREPDVDEGEKPVHRVRITKTFYLAKHEVTRGQFARFVDETDFRTEAERDGKGGIGPDAQGSWFKKPEYTWRNPGFLQEDDHPVVNVSWNDAVAFCEWLSRKEGKTYRLPTEAEWEYACRAGTTTAYHHGDDPQWVTNVANVADGTFKAKYPNTVWPIENRDGHVFTAPVGWFKPNAFGLHDMHGNVFEWCSDRYDGSYYGRSPVDDPAGPSEGIYRVTRGGGWLYAPVQCRSALRQGSERDYRNSMLGFRAALVP